MFKRERFTSHLRSVVATQTQYINNTAEKSWYTIHITINRVERDEYRRPKTYAVRVQFSLFLICWVEREKLLFLLFKSGFDDAMNMENDNINNSL